MITAYHLYTGADGDSHVVRGQIPDATLVKAESIQFKETAAHSTFDWHDAPNTQYVITLSGTLEFTTRGGETFTLRPGDILVAMDTTGSGHKWRLVDDQPWRRAYIIFADGADPNFIPDNNKA
ncbi:MAG TPA: cupin domain-containing protein [Puia sp.]|nr:cupin domain-containing protein [Puia sp.]